ncbi:ABC transporter substrate-binding protein [Nitratireductor basaltis]|uniref:Extracellular solute-binding protein family 1 n=1 Tax=Nitratireductor basaltis TaxID=472175 RepID=A0A084U8S9_9HYPH|nr:sugar ABC transporter substrate-binding protein [Nitratireductor basaltis]KFB09365.1 Extracellular solute-binding protein family 1 [Nitratireductor basaltis]
MKTVLRTSGLVVALLMSSSAMAEDLRFTVWTGNEAHLSMLNAIAEGFKETHPDVTVTFETIPAADYVQKLTFQLAGGNAPDLGWLGEEPAPAFVDAGMLEDIGTALRAKDGYDYADFATEAMGLWVNGDSVYGIPFSTSPFMLYYNKTMFDAAGAEDPLALASKGEWTWEKLREVAQKVSAANDKWGFEFKDGEGYDSRIMHALMPPIRAYGGFAWKDGRCGFAEPEAVEAVTLLHEMVFEDKTIVPPGEQGDFFAGDAAMTINQISRASRLTDAGFDWGIAPLPTGPAGESPVVGQAGIVVFAKGDKKELATEFLAHMTNAENVATMAQFFPPARKSILDDAAFTDSNPNIPAEQMANVKAAINEGTVLPAHERMPQILAALKPRSDALWRADADVTKALEAMCSAIEPNL